MKWVKQLARRGGLVHLALAKSLLEGMETSIKKNKWMEGMQMLEGKERLVMLRVPFEDHEISKLPKMTRNQISDKDNYTNCKICGGWHHKNAIHLDYVGHAALTARLLDVDPLWTWEPCSDMPGLDNQGGMWIKLTVCDVTRLGYGHAEGNNSNKSAGDLVKEVIGDALRNAAMRFGAALELWDKSHANNSRGKKCSDAVRDNFDSIYDVKQALLEQKFDTAAEAFSEITEEDRAAIGLATTKGGIFTIEESKMFQDPRWSEARKLYIQSKNEAA